MPACNQGPHVRTTCESAYKALGDVEIIVLDDQSLDGCCDHLPDDVRVIRPPAKLGCPAARQYLEAEATGDALVWTDPHCEFDDAFAGAVDFAMVGGNCIVQPVIETIPPAGRRYGAKWSKSIRGISRKRTFSPGKTHLDAMYGGIYACRRDVWKDKLGWLPLPGVTSSQDNGLSLLCWFADVDMLCYEKSTCRHMKMEHYSGLPKRDHPYEFHDDDRVLNNVGVHWAFFERTWDRWEGTLRKWLDSKQRTRKWVLESIIALDIMARLRGHVQQRAVRDDVEFMDTFFFRSESWLIS